MSTGGSEQRAGSPCKPYGPTLKTIFSLSVAGCDDIIRQHKAACLRITALLACKDILWIGTSAGVVATMHIPPIAKQPLAQGARIAQLPPLVGESHFT